MKKIVIRRLTTAPLLAYENIDMKLPTEKREDFSKFVVHLTRDDHKDFEDGSTAEKNFLNIIKEERIGAFRAQCLHSNKIPDDLAHRFAVCCFSEVPLNQIHLLTENIQGRSINLEPYGLVFRRDFILSKKAQPALYINNYDENSWLRGSFDRVFDIAKNKGFNQGKLWRILPFINIMNEDYDFSWEREWRVRGDLKFKISDIVCVILPPNKSELTYNFTKNGIPVISPGWTYEQIVLELSKQQKKAKRFWNVKKTLKIKIKK
jgi:hypothetical protein